jgi:DNA-binding transcriptional LysR family regulator
MDRLREMEVFVAIVDRGSFTGAAEKVGMSAAAVSRAVNALETRLGTHLLARTTRSVRPTDAGMAYVEACRKVLDTITDAEANIAVDQFNPVGTLTVSAPVLFGQRYVAPLVNAFALRYPDVSINAVYVDRTTRLLEEGVDIALRVDLRRSVRLCAASNLRVSLLSGYARRTPSPQGSGQSPLCVLHWRLAAA